MMNGLKKGILIGAVLAAVLLLNWYLGRIVSPQQLQRLIEGCGGWAPLAYIGAFILLPVFFFPVAVLALAGGLLFGLGWGTVYTVIGAGLNCALMFFIARRLGRRQVEAFLQRRLSPVWQARLAKVGGREGFFLLILLRLIPAVPYNLINYAFGLTQISFRSYALASLIGILPGTVVFINIGDKLLDVSSPDFWLAVGLLVLLLAVTAVLGKVLFPGRR